MLFNAKLFNTAMFDGGTTIAPVYSTDAAVFEDFSLSDGTHMVLTEPPKFGPTRDPATDAVPRGHGMYKNSALFRVNTIELRGYVKHTSAALLDAYLDTLRMTLEAEDGNLDLIDQNGTVKRYVATCDNFEEMFADRQRYHLTICPFAIRFRCFDPFGKARDYTSQSYFGMSTSGTVQSVVNPGTRKARLVLGLLFSAASSVTAITVTNSTTGEAITYTGAVAAGDALVFDGENLRVTKNSTAGTFTGAFPTLAVGANLLAVTVTGASFTLSSTIKYRRTYQ
jgi:hypothetical protein